MKILVCIKQISTSDINMDGSGQWVTDKNSSSLAISRFDENALEEAILLKERLKDHFGLTDTSVDVISVGGITAAESIKRAMGMGADNGIHIVTEDKGYVSAAVTASRLAIMVKGMGDVSCSSCPYDLVLTGIMSEDLMQAQVGPMLAEHLNIPCVTSVINVKLNDILNNRITNDNKLANTENRVKKEIEIQRELEGGIRQNIKLKLPALLTIQAGINQPRYPSLSNILRANKQQIESCKVSNLFDNQTCYSSTTNNFLYDPIHIVRVEYPEKKREGRVLYGTTEDKANELRSILKQRGLI